MDGERYIIDDAGTLIDIETRDTYDYISDVCSVLNEQEKEIRELKFEIKKLRCYLRLFNNLAQDYNLTHLQLCEIIEEAIEKKEVFNGDDFE